MFQQKRRLDISWKKKMENVPPPNSGMRGWSHRFHHNTIKKTRMRHLDPGGNALSVPMFLWSEQHFNSDLVTNYIHALKKSRSPRPSSSTKQKSTYQITSFKLPACCQNSKTKSAKENRCILSLLIALALLAFCGGRPRFLWEHTRPWFSRVEWSDARCWKLAERGWKHQPAACLSAIRFEAGGREVS